ncbi:hypothetical protein [Nonomuraea turkmeniaca]|nr:hypothetical protein [Nonomuraea turkmeniaca]
MTERMDLGSPAGAALHGQEPAALVVAVATIDAGNRMGVATRMTPESYK